MAEYYPTPTGSHSLPTCDNRRFRSFPPTKARSQPPLCSAPSSSPRERRRARDGSRILLPAPSTGSSTGFARGLARRGAIMSDREVYLGDGLYCSFDGYQIRLRAPRDGADHVVFLDAATLQALLEF